MGITQQTPKKQKGFTIIEVVLVLAIVGLIFLIVFIALPQLQKTRRDAQRRKDIGRVMAGLETYATDHETAYPDSQVLTDSFKSTYLSDNFKDPSTGSTYTITYGTTAPAAIGDITYRSSAKCGSDGALSTTGTGSKHVAVSAKLENGVYCEDNQ